MKNNYVTPTVTTFFYQEDIVTSSGTVGVPESRTSFDEMWLD